MKIARIVRMNKQARISNLNIFLLVFALFVVMSAAETNTSGVMDIGFSILPEIIPDNSSLLPQNLSDQNSPNISLPETVPENTYGNEAGDNNTNATAIDTIVNTTINTTTLNSTPLNFELNLYNKRGDLLGQAKQFQEFGNQKIELSVSPATASIGLTTGLPTAKIFLENPVLNGSSSRAVIDDYDSSAQQPVNSQITTPVISIENISITSATIQLPKTGKVEKIFRCTEFDSETFSCIKWEATGIPFIDNGEMISFNVTHFSAYAGGEIIAIDAVHLSNNSEFISNIYEKINTIDGQWSEPIYEDEFVRVTFEKELVNGRYIDVVARSNGTIAYFDVYEAGTNHKVGRSAAIDSKEWQFLQVKNLTKPTTEFDFKVVKIVTPEEEVYELQKFCPANCKDDLQGSCVEECYIECDTITAHSARAVFIEFDFIHDDFINSSQADGLIGYGELNIATPRYRTWNISNRFTAEQTDAVSVGVDGTDDITWVVTKGSHERDEMIMGTEDKSNDINIQVYNTSKRWGNLLEVTADISNSAFRAFDIGVEDISGKSLIVYEGRSTADDIISYRTWNGTDYSSETNFSTGLTSSVFNWVKLVPQLKSNSMMLLISNAASALYAVPWNGTGFDTTRNLTLTTTISSTTQQAFSFAWEVSGGEGLALYGSSTNIVSRTYNSSNSPFWSGEATIALGGTDTLRAVRSCSDPASDYIGFIWQDSGSDVSPRMWNGSSVLASPPTEDAATEASGTNNNNFDCAWYNSSTALFGFVDVSTGSNGLLSMDYFTFTRPSDAWSVSDLTTAPTTTTFATDDIDGLRFTKHPSTSEIMITAMDIAEDISLIRWDGTAFVTIAESPIEASTEVLNGAQESVMFDWYRYDPVPNVTNVSPSGLTFSFGATIDINATVRDNINASVVSANITIPNGTVRQITLTDLNKDEIFNSTFSATSVGGTYTIRIIVNDTSTHDNVNSTQTSTFTITDSTNPSVTAHGPFNRSIFNASTVIEVAANVTDNGAISVVYANITYPNTTITQITLNLAVDSKYNNSFTTPGLLGTYNVTYFANDSSNNINSSVTSNFTVQDRVNPSVPDVLPSQNTTYNASDTIMIMANVTDDVAVSRVFANISEPNGTIKQLELTFRSANRYNNTFTAPALAGGYNLTFFANDSSGNDNRTVTSNFSIQDRINPSVPDVLPPQNTTYNASDTIMIAANVTDDVAVSRVFANISEPNGTIKQLELTFRSANRYNNTFTAPGLVGGYNLTFFANDSSGNDNRTVTSNFSIQDRVNPSVPDVLPTVNSVYNVSEVIRIAANVTDDVNVSRVFINISEPNSTIKIFELIFDSGNRYNTTFTTPSVLGTYNVTFVANDSTNNQNRTVMTNFTVQDRINPSVTVHNPQARSLYNVSNTIEIAANVTDDLAVSIVYANITYPNTTISQVTLSLVSGTNKYNNSFTAIALLGNFNVTYFANDSSNNINSTLTTNFTINDVTTPNVTINSPSDGSSYTTNSNISIEVNVTDTIGVSIVSANITFPNSTQRLYSLTDLNSDQVYNTTFNETSSVGTYTIRAVANDTSNNINNSRVNTFNVISTTFPVVTLVSPADAAIQSSSTITFTCNATDSSGGLANSTLYHNITGAFTVNQTNSTITGSSNQTSFTFSSIADGTYLWNCLFSNTGGNKAFASVNRTVYIDTTNPAVVGVLPLANNVYNVSNVIEIGANVSDAFTISVVYANITYPNTTISQVTLSLASGTKYNNSFTIPGVKGGYNITIYANDTVGNINSSSTSNFTVNDIVNPSVTIHSPQARTAYNVSNVIEIAANVTDDVNVTRAYANITYPNTTISQLTLSIVSGTNKYNNSFTAPALIGNYNVTFFANDSTNNINSSVTSNFTINDVVIPSVTAHSPQARSLYNASTVVEIAANVTDDVNVSRVYANVTYPNTTISQLTLSIVAGTSKYNNSFTTPGLLGTYNVTYFANDSSNNINSSVTSNLTVQDRVNPSLTVHNPIARSAYNVSIIVEIAANVTDDVNVTRVYANITYPNTTVSQLALTLVSGNKYNASFTTPILLGNYNVTFFANDSSENENRTVASNFTVQDTGLPSITIVGCIPTNINLSQSIQCNATVTDDIKVHTVKANVTLPNGTIEEQTITNRSAGAYNFTFSNSVLVGLYNITWWANDTSDNQQNTTSNFNVSDITSPTITLNAPANNSNLSSSTVAVNFTASDNYYTKYNCSVYLNNTLNQSESSTSNGTLTTFSLSRLLEGTHSWNITCNDNSSNLNATSQRFFTVDTRPVTFVSLSTSPSAEDDLDPNTLVTVGANVTENITAVHTVILEYKLTSASSYTNVTMSLNSSGGYNASFNATNNGTYSLRIWANDSADNEDVSSQVNISVQYDRTWTRTPSSFTAVVATLNQNTSVGNLTINNTGDFSFNFTITSDSAETRYNQTANFSVGSGGGITIAVYDNATVVGVKTIRLNISVNDSSANPTSLATTGSIVVASGQPILISTFTTPSSETISGTAGQTNVPFTASVDNRGPGNATNVTFYMTLPSGWNVTFGSTNQSISQITPGDSFENSIELTIPGDATAGTYTIKVNASGVNDTGANLNDINGTFGDVVFVTLVSAVTPLVSAGVVGGGSSTETASSSPGGGGGGSGGGGSPIGLVKNVDVITFSEETIHILRGQTKTIPITITNPYQNATLKDVTLDLSGFLANYISVEPTSIPLIRSLASTQFYLTLNVPSYLTEAKFLLSATIKGTLVAQDAESSGFTTKKFTEVRTLVLKVDVVEVKKLTGDIDLAIKQIQEMKDQKLFVQRLEDLLKEAQEAVKNQDLSKAQVLIDTINKERESAYVALGILEQLKESISHAHQKWLKIPKTDEAFQLALLSMERGEFTVALERLKNAQLLYVLETKNKINVTKFVLDWWWALLIAAFFSVVLIFVFYHQARTFILKEKIKSLNKEEETIRVLLLENQKKYIVERSISEAQYERYNDLYQTRMTKIQQQRVNVRHQRVNLVSPEEELQSIKKEKSEIEELSLQNQKEYLVGGKMGRKDFLARSTQNKQRLSEIEQEESLVAKRTSIMKKSFKYRVVSSVRIMGGVLRSVLLEKGLKKLFQRSEKKSSKRKKKKEK